jgi:protoheme IX farnesyltransferase
MTVVKEYYRLAKPGIVYGNDLTAIGGFFLAAGAQLELRLLIEMLLGLSLVMASGCVFNNFLDRGLDQKMARTKNRALPQQLISARAALIFGSVLLLAGSGLLALTNWLTLSLGVFGWIMYVWVYGWAKRATIHGTLIGSISGAVPPIVGYCAVKGRLDEAAVFLFLILVAWQMPHFYAIALRRKDDYAAAGLPVLPVVRDLSTTRRMIIVYAIGFLLASLGLFAIGATKWTYLIAMVGIGLWWLQLAGRSPSEDPGKWAKQIFGFSLVILMVFSGLLVFNVWLP